VWQAVARLLDSAPDLPTSILIDFAGREGGRVQGPEAKPSWRTGFRLDLWVAAA